MFTMSSDRLAAGLQDRAAEKHALASILGPGREARSTIVVAHRLHTVTSFACLHQLPCLRMMRCSCNLSLYSGRQSGWAVSVRTGALPEITGSI
jgi:hypothetical protein